MSTINKINVDGTSYDIEDTTKQPLLEAGENITIENNVISASGGGGGSEPIILDGTTYDIYTTYSDTLSTLSDAFGKKLIEEIQTKLVGLTETSDNIYLKLNVNYFGFGTTRNKTNILFKCVNIISPEINYSSYYDLIFIMYDNRHLKASDSSAYNYQITLRLPSNFETTKSGYEVRYNEIMLAGRRYTNRLNNNQLTMASKDVIFKDDTEAYTPTASTHPANKGYVDTYLTTLTGYDASKTQILKNISGVLTWVDE